MLTPQDIQTQEFAKAVFGGYDMASVDDFLEKVTEDYTALYKDNAVLKGKLKVLVEKVEEYRSTEDAMRMALLTAQRMSDELLEDTKRKCDEILASAARDADVSRARASQDLTDETMKLEAAKLKTASFVSASRQIIDQYQSFLDRLDSVTAEFGGAPEPVAPAQEHEEPVFSPEPERAEKPAPESIDTDDETMRQIDEVVADILGENKAAEGEEDLPAAPFDPDSDTRRVDTEAVRKIYSDDGDTKRIDWDEEELTPRPKFDFSDLRFGVNYSDGKGSAE